VPEDLRGAKSLTALKLGDFTTSVEVLYVSALAIAIGIVSAFVALALLRLIGFFTNVFFYHRIGSALVSPAGNTLGWLEIFVPTGAALIVGFMARYGSERIRGHGIPEAIEAILISGSRIEPKVAILKPVSSAISIGSGGPFGAEGPIIMTGGAVGSMIAQMFKLTSMERRTLLVAGAAGGMSATFASPLAAVLLSVELLLFEWKPRSLIPVGLASAAADIMRHYLIGPGPLFPVPAHPAFIGVQGLLACIPVGVLAGILSLLLTAAVYAAEDGFMRLPIHWMWWPPIGGLAIGIGGLVFPQALGVGYDTIEHLVTGSVPGHVIAGILIVKACIWAISLGSGTSGGVLAPLLMMGGALGGLEAAFLPNEGLGFWQLISMGAILGGTMRSPFTGVVFAIELTHDLRALLPLLVATLIAHCFTVLTLKRSILTEKVARRGYHLSREYAVDPLEVLFVREVMRTTIAALPSQITRSRLKQSLHLDHKWDEKLVQMLYPVVSSDNHMVGIVTRRTLEKLMAEDWPAEDRSLAEVANPNPVVAYPDEPLRVVIYRMAETGLTRFPVVSPKDPAELLGIVSLYDLLRARVRALEEERRRERILKIHLPFGIPRPPAKPVP
jgi:chloride channel protein, CIC family